MSRLHAHTLELLVRALAPDVGWILRIPSPGWFRATVNPGTWCGPRTEIGTLDVLGRRYLLVTPSGIAGLAQDVASTAGTSASGDPHSLSSRAVGYGDAIAWLSSQTRPAGTGAEAASGASAAAVAAARSADGLIFRAPTSGRFYGRSAPDKPAFVAEGTQLTQGVTICLLEVMKTFHRVTYGGPDLPETARITRVLVADGADVNAGDPLLALA